MSPIVIEYLMSDALRQLVLNPGSAAFSEHLSASAFAPPS